MAVHRTAPQVPVRASQIRLARLLEATMGRDVADAPTFRDVAPVVVDALCGAVFASYNVYFDSKFVRDELRRVGVSAFPPHLCLMYMRPMLGLGRKCSLRDACVDSGVAHARAHCAATDAKAAAALWTQYAHACGRAGVRTFSDLAELRSYKFTTSFREPLLGEAARLPACNQLRMKSRAGMTPQVSSPRDIERSERQAVLAAYWDALTVALADLDVTPHEVFYLKAKQSALGVRREELRWMHARAFSGILAEMCQDKAITDHEASTLSGVALALRELGWAPGDEPSLSVSLV